MVISLNKSMNIEQKAINTLRFLSVDQVNKANSGHPGAPMGAAPIAYTLFKKIMNHNPKTLIFKIEIDSYYRLDMPLLCFLLSFMSNRYDFSIEDLKKFRQLDQKLLVTRKEILI